jgi:hypothetical protein
MFSTALVACCMGLSAQLAFETGAWPWARGGLLSPAVRPAVTT